MEERKGAPTVVGAVPVLVPDGRAVGMGRPGHQPLLWDQASSALVVVFHHQKGIRAGVQSHHVHTLVHHTQRETRAGRELPGRTQEHTDLVVFSTAPADADTGGTKTALKSNKK